MNRTVLYSLCAITAISITAAASRKASAGGQSGALVRLQSSTPGVQQGGHANVNGTIQAGQFVGGGAGVTDVNADLLDGINSTSFLQAVPNPLNLSGSATAIVSGTNSNATIGSAGVKGVSSAATGQTYGVWGSTTSNLGRGVYGLASATSGSAYGVFGESESTSGRAVIGLANATTGTTYGGYFDSDSVDGYGVLANTAGPYGLYATSTRTTGTAYGVFAASASFSGVGVFGDASSLSGTNYGGRFESAGSTGRGVYGFGRATGATETPYGVRGQASTATAGYGVYAVGDSGASGTKSFRIDHPFDPENKYLLHYSSESPFPQNFYNGNVTTDGNGKAWVDLPYYFQEINTNFKYTLTVVDDGENATFVQAKVGRKIKNNRFLIMTSAPNVEVSWRVDADRNDRRIQVNRPTDEREKHGIERGKYEHPEYYGLPKETGMDNSPTPTGRGQRK